MRQLLTVAGPGFAVLLVSASLPTRAATAEDAVRFLHRPTQKGDRAVQNVRFDLALKMTYRQGDQVASQESTQLTRTQRRTVTVREVEGARATAALVRFEAAEARMRSGNGEPEVQEQPVQGKTYQVVREGDALRITDEEGHIPPFEEFSIVAAALDSLGRPNPLASFLAGRTVRVGQTLQIPKELGAMLLEGTEQLGEVSRFEISLQRVERVGGRRRGVFQTRLEAQSPGSTQMALQVGGTAVVEVETCRVLELHFTGPLALVQTRAAAGSQYQVTGNGRLQIAMAAQYIE